MQKSTFEKNTILIVASLNRELPRHYDAVTVDKLRKTAITLRKIFECQCNGCTREKLPSESWKDYDIARINQMEWVEKRDTVLRKRIEKLADSIGLKFYIQGDPRGCSLYLSNFDKMNHTNYSTTGIACI
jgi:hypothetical protein